MRKTILTSLFAATTLLAGAGISMATEECGMTNKADWMSIEAISAKAAEMGYDVRKVEVDDGCYEVYGIKDGVKTEVYFHPVSAEVVKVELDD